MLTRKMVGLSAAVLLILAGCSAPAGSDSSQEDVIRVGYFPNITHSQALIGLARGDFQEALGPDVTIQPTLFNAGPSAIEAIFAGEIDLSYIGPNPAINGYVQSHGEALRIVSGATSGGAALVVHPDSGIESAADLDGARLASPQLGNTQDVALRNYLFANGLNTIDQGGTVEVIPTANPDIFDLFRRGEIDGAWVPEPWASRLVVEGGGVVLVDERDLWPDGDFVTAHIIVRTEFLEEHPDWVRAWLDAHVQITQWELENPEDAQVLINEQIEALTGQPLGDEVLAQAWGRMTPTWDPISASLYESASAAYRIGFLDEEPDLDGIYDLSLLNEVLAANGLPEVSDGS